MARLDRTRPFDLVYSSDSGLRLAQDGKVFLPNGCEVGVEDTLPRDRPYDPLTADEAHTRVATDVEHMHWQQLRVLVEAYGGVWKDKDEAVRFLHGRGV